MAAIEMLSMTCAPRGQHFSTVTCLRATHQRRTSIPSSRTQQSEGKEFIASLKYVPVNTESGSLAGLVNIRSLNTVPEFRASTLDPPLPGTLHRLGRLQWRISRDDIIVGVRHCLGVRVLRVRP